MKEKNHTCDFVELYEVTAFLAKLPGSDEITSARRQRAATTGYVEPVEAYKLELLMEKCVGLLLKTSVGAGNDESVWPVGRPFDVRI